MRTPGADRELALGFLYAEGVIRSLDDVGSVAHCGRPGEEGFGNVIDVLPGAGVVLAPERVAGTRRGTLTAAACGVCGRQCNGRSRSARCAPVADDARIEATALARFIRSMRDRQEVFDAHRRSARGGAVRLRGELDPVREDVGRHNAVDKLVGSARSSGRSRRATTCSSSSGRVSFEIVQKAAMLGIPIVAAVSAPSSLAIELAERASRSTLVGFVRGEARTSTARPSASILLVAPDAIG